MKVQIFCLSLLLSSLQLPFAVAQEKSSSGLKKTVNSTLESFNSKWSYSETIKKNHQTSQLETKLFKRQMWIKNIPVSLVETTYVFVKNPQADVNEKNNELAVIAKEINKSFSNHLLVTKKKNNYLIEGAYKKSNKYMMIELVKNQNSIAVITSSVRLGLKDHLIPEVRELHDLLEKYSGESLAKTKKTSFFPSLIENAFAVDFMNIADIINGSNNPIGSSGSLGGPKNNQLTNIDQKLSGLEDSVGALNTNLQLTNTNWSNTNNQFEGLNTNWSQTNQTMQGLGLEFGAKADGLNNNWNKTNETLEKLGSEFGIKADDLNKNWADTNKAVDGAAKELGQKADDLNKNWADTNIEISKGNKTAEKFADEYSNMNGNWAESNKILAKAMDPQHMAKLAFYTAAGAALGGIAVNLAVQGVTEGISFLHELFTGAKEKKLEWGEFQKAMEVWDTKLNDLVKMEQLVDGYINAFNFFESKNLGNDYEKQLNLAMRDMRFDRDMFFEKFKNQDLALECRKLFYDASDELDQQLKNYDKIIQFAQVQNLALNGANYFCAQLKDLQRKILLAETQMQDVRLKILKAENQFYSKELDVIKDRDKDLAKINGRLPKTLKEKREFEEKIADRLKAKNKVTRKSWLEECMDGKNADGARIKEELKGSFFIISYFKKRSRCNGAFAKVEPMLLKQDEQKLRSIALEEGLRETLELKQNAQVEVSLSQEQINWMSRVHMDAYCYQFAHQKNEPMPQKCSEFPEMLFSLSLSRGYEKAKDAYENKCQDRYLKGLENLALTSAVD